MKTMQVNGVPVEVVKKRIMRMYIRVRPSDGRVQVTAPSCLTDGEIERFVRSRADWICRQHERFPGGAQPAFAGGETHRLWGQAYRLQLCDTEGRSRAFADGDRLVLCVKPGTDADARKKLLDGFYRAQMERMVPPLLDECQKLAGYRAADFRIRDMTTRWGTCNTATAVITLNLQLARLDPAYLRYVILHELTHLYEPGHNARFYARMDQVCPGWKEVRKNLRNEGMGQ